MAEVPAANVLVTCQHCGTSLGFPPVLPAVTPEAKLEAEQAQAKLAEAEAAAQALGVKPAAKSGQSSAAWAGSWLLFFAASSCFVGFAFLLTSVYERLFVFSHTRGWVTDFNPGAIPGTDVPTVAFRTPDDQAHTFVGNAGPYKLGQQVDVAYHRDNPNRASLLGFWDLWTGPVMLGSFSALCGLAWWGTRRRHSVASSRKILHSVTRSGQVKVASWLRQHSPKT
jgi:hypothetical protein